MDVKALSWLAVVSEDSAAWRMLATATLGFQLAAETDGYLAFAMPGGGFFEVYNARGVPPYGYNDGIAVGFAVDDIRAASTELADAGCELLGEITRLEEYGYAFRHFRGPDGRVYGLNEQK